MNAESSVARAQRVWRQLKETYGKAFVDSHGPIPTDPWISAIDGLSEEQLAFGLRHVRIKSPDFPPTLPRFEQSCRELPNAALKSIGSIQEQLTEYVMLKRYRGQMTAEQRKELSWPWIFVYREWTDVNREKNQQRCAECVGVIIENPNGTKIGYTVLQMFGDTEVHESVMRRLDPARRARDSQNAARERLGFDAP